MRFSRTFISLATSLFLILPASGAFAVGGAVKLGGGTTAAPAPAPEPMPSPAQCGRFPDNASSYRCLCPADARAGSVWGSGPYTADSNVCTAARHSGVIGADGGVVTLEAAPGQASYQGSVANGVKTNDWGAYGRSFTFVGAPARSSGLPACGQMPSGEAALQCACTGSDGELGASVWGSGPYTADSGICAAAVHAGVLQAGQPGAVSVLRIQGLDAYSGSTANGVTTRRWGAYDSSITFNRN